MKLKLEEYKSIIDNLHEGIIIYDENFKIHFANHFISTLLDIDYTQDLNLLDLIHSESSDIVKINSVVSDEDNSIIDVEFIKNNTFIRMSLNNYIDDNGDRFYISICEDITSIHREEIVKSCIYKISEAIHDVNDLQSLYKEIHYIVAEVTKTNNFYIALVDWDTETITFPYFVDEMDKQPKPQKMKKRQQQNFNGTGRKL